jgi:heme exporter protein B
MNQDAEPVMRNNSWQLIWMVAKKEFRYDMRQRYSFASLLLYGLVTVFLIFLLIENIEPYIWNALYWVVLLFMVVNAIVKSFTKEDAGIMLYYYQTISARQFLLAKIIYHTLLTIVLGAFLLVFFMILGNPIVHYNYMALSTLLGCISISVLFSFLGALNNKAGQPGSMNVVLGFPLLIPQMILLVRVNNIAINEAFNAYGTYYLAILGYAVLIIIAGWVLFPYVWRS